MTPLRKSRHSSKRSTVIYSTDGELRRSDYGFIFSDDIDRWCNSKYRLAKVKSHNKQREELLKRRM